jgi:UDP-glucose 4-epimerase
MAGNDFAATYNIGTGTGTSVREVMLAIKSITGIDFAWDVCPPRAGDPAQVVADATKIRRDLGWQSRHCLDGMIASAWQAWSGSPVGREAG